MSLCARNAARLRRPKTGTKDEPGTKSEFEKVIRESPASKQITGKEDDFTDYIKKWTTQHKIALGSTTKAVTTKAVDCLPACLTD